MRIITAYKTNTYYYNRRECVIAAFICSVSVTSKRYSVTD